MKLSIFASGISKTQNVERKLWKNIRFKFKVVLFRFDGSSFNDAPSSNHNHSFVQLARYDDKPFVTGSFERLETNNAYTEKLDNGAWTELDPYPDATL